MTDEPSGRPSRLETVHLDGSCVTAFIRRSDVTNGDGTFCNFAIFLQFWQDGFSGTAVERESNPGRSSKEYT